MGRDRPYQSVAMIKVGFCVAYDWPLLAHSLPLIYKAADRICLSLDRDRISWSGNPFTWDDQAFRQLVKKIDVDHKIRVLEDDFHLPHLSPMQNEVRQRMCMADALGEGGWHIQLDSDEFFLDFGGFVAYLKRLKPRRKINVVCPWITLYKQDSTGFFYVQPNRFREIESIQIATMWPKYEFGRRNGYFNVLANFPILHLSWARSPEEIREKLWNWGHRDDVLRERLMQVYEDWCKLNRDNYTGYINFHMLEPERWPRLAYVACKSVEELIQQSKADLQLPLNRFRLLMANSIWVSRFVFLFRRIFRTK